MASTIAIGVALGVTGEEHVDDLALWVVALAQVPLWIGIAGVPWWASRTKGLGTLREDFGLWMRWPDVPIGTAVGLACQGLLSLLAPPLYRLIDVDPDKIGESAEALADRADDPFGVICLFLVVVVGAALFEELCYRGLLLRSLQRRLRSTAWSVVVSGVVFGAIHFDLYTFPLLTLFGIVLAVLTVRAGRLGPAIWAHVAFNLSTLVVLLLQ